MKKLILFLLLSVSQMFGATYYIDYNASNDSANGTSTSTPWKRAPGMTGFAGTYTHAVGDIFIFRENVTWPAACYPWVIANSGSSGNIDTYISSDSWYFGSVGKAIFDGGAALTVGGMIQATFKSYLTFDNLTVQNHGAIGTTSELGYSSPQAVDFYNCHHLKFANMRWQTYSQRTLYVHSDSSGSKDSYEFSDSEISNCASFLWFTAGSATTSTDGLIMRNLWIYDGYTQIGNDGNILNDGVHSDGFLHAFSIDSSPSWTVTNIEIYNCKATGSWARGFGNTGGCTAFIFFEGVALYSGSIYNNDFRPSPMDAKYFEAMITVGYVLGGSLNYFNNTFRNIGPADDAATAAILLKGGGGTHTVKNNIMSGWRFAMNTETVRGDTYIIDYNLEDNTSGQNGTTQYPDTDGHFKYYSVWQASPFFFDINSVLGTSPTYYSSSDSHLTASSAGVTDGVNLTSLGITGLNSDKDGIARPATGAWRMGAYNTDGVGGSAPSAPSSLATGSPTSSTLSLNWTDNSSDETGFQLEQSPNGSTGWTQIATPAANATSATATGLPASTTYYFRLRAINSSGNSSYSSTASGTTSAGVNSQSVVRLRRGVANF